MHVGNRTIPMGPGPAMINRTRQLGPRPVVVPGGRVTQGRDGVSRSGSAGSAEGGTVTNNGTVTNSGGASQPGLPGTSTVGDAQTGFDDIEL